MWPEKNPHYESSKTDLLLTLDEKMDLHKLGRRSKYRVKMVDATFA